MTITRSRILGLVLIAAGLVVLLVGASAAVGYVTDTSSSASPQAATAGATAPSSTRAVLDVDAPGLLLHRDAGVPVVDALPLDALPADERVSTPDVLPGVGVRAALVRQGEAPSQTSAPALQVLSQAAQRMTTPAAEAVALGAAAFAGAGLLAYFWTAIKSALALPVVSLYAKISRADVFENAVRERIFAAIRDHPGLSASDLAKQAGVSWGTTIYHLEVLEQNRMVSSLRKGRHRRYFENGAQLTASKEVVAILQNPVTANVKKLVELSPGMTQKDLAGALQMSPQALHWHLSRLAGAGVVTKQREGRVVRHFAAVASV